MTAALEPGPTVAEPVDIASAGSARMRSLLSFIPTIATDFFPGAA